MVEIKQNMPLAPLTTFGIGGNAKFYVEISSVKGLKEAIKFASEKKIDFYILSGGSNVLVSDKGYNGLIIKIKIQDLQISDNKVTAGAGLPLIKLIKEAAEAGLSGMEPLAGIPGTLGGAIRGNAGAYGGEICNCIESIRVLDVVTLEEKIISKEDAKFGYRRSIFKQNKNLAIISATINLKHASKEEVLKKIDEILAKRSGKDYGGKNAGSFFMNPVVSNERLREEFEKDTGAKSFDETLPAGWLIDMAGLRGKKIGNAAVSEIHGNFIINTGNATSDEIMMLVSYVKQQVRDKTGIQLQEEINYIGF